MKNFKKRVLTGCVATFALAVSFGFASCDLSAFFPSNESPSGQVKADFTYELVGNSYTIIGRGTNDSGILEFPSEFNGKPVTAIGEGAFSSDVDLGKVIIPDCITTIGESAFYNCVNLKTVEMGDGVTDIPKETFKNCVFLDTLTLPAELVSIGEGAFFKCAKLRSVEFPDTVEVIGEKAFYDCSWLETVDFSSALETIGAQAFSNCTTLKEVVIPDGAPTVIGESAFTIVDDRTGKLRMSIEKVSLGNSVLSIGENAFKSNSRLRELVLGDSVQAIGANAFYKCRKMYLVSFGANVPTCSATAFDGCEAVREIVDGSGTLTKGDTGIMDGILASTWCVRTPSEQARVFYDEATGVVYYLGTDIPYSGIEGRDGAAVISTLFDHFDEAQKLVVPDTYMGKPVLALADKAFYNEEFLSELDTGKCEYIGYQLCQNAYGLMKLYLRESVKTIAKNAFLNTNSLTEVYFYCGSSLTSVGESSFRKKKSDTTGELAGVQYKNVYFKGTETEWEDFKEKLLGSSNQNRNEDLLEATVECF